MRAWLCALFIVAPLVASATNEVARFTTNFTAAQRTSVIPTNDGLSITNSQQLPAHINKDNPRLKEALLEWKLTNMAYWKPLKLPVSSTNITPARPENRPVSEFPTDERFQTTFRPPAPFYNTNSRIPLEAVEGWERYKPGIRTNFLPSQFYDLKTNPPHLREKELIRQRWRLPDYIRSDDTNFYLLWLEWERTNVPPPRPANWPASLPWPGI